MDAETRPDPLWTTTSQVAIIELGFITLALIAGRLIPHSGAGGYGVGLIVAGVVAWLIGVSKTLQPHKSHLGYRSGYVRLAGPTDPIIDVPREEQDTSGVFMLLMFAVGMINILIGVALTTLGG